MTLGAVQMKLARGPEINENGALIPSQHDIGGFDVPMQPIAVMHFRQGLAQRFRQPLHLVGRQAADAFQARLQRLALQILHDDIGRVVLQEHVVDIHDVPRAETGDDPRFLQRLLARVAEIVPLRRGHRHAGAEARRAQIQGEQFLDGHGPPQFPVRALVRDAEASFAQDAPDGELALVQGAAHRQITRRGARAQPQRRAARRARVLAGGQG